MWIVALALRRPYTFVVMALLILILSPIIILRTPTDVFPNINIPVISMVWNYQGLSPQDMANRITTVSERGLTTLVNDIEHIESQSLNGIAVVKIYFQPTANIQTALAQVTAIAQTVIRQMPPGTTPPLIIQYSASTVPILQIGLSSRSLPEQQLNDVALNFLRTQLITVPGAAIPYPYGGKQRVVSVDIDTPAMQAKHLTPVDVVNAITTQNLILPSGTAKIGPLEYQIELNASPLQVAELNDIPIKTVNGATIYIRDVAHVRDGFTPQTNVVRQDGTRGTLLSILKNGNASTTAVVKAVQDMLPHVVQTLPEGLSVKQLFDQ
jgi:multidrug efflux pump subunit AcrB